MTANQPGAALPCQHCQSTAGYYRQTGAWWCFDCGHKKGHRRAVTGPPTTSPEIQIRRLDVRCKPEA